MNFCRSRILLESSGASVFSSLQGPCSWRLKGMLELLTALEVVVRMPSFALTDVQRQSLILVICSRIRDLLQQEISESLATQVRFDPK